jgi:hypothetical protein
MKPTNESPRNRRCRLFAQTRILALCLAVLSFSIVPTHAQTPTFEWAVKAGSVGGWGTGIAVDAAGNVYVTGQADDTGLLAAKFDGTGKHLWTKKAGGDSIVVGRGIGVDAAGNIYVAGYANNGTIATFDNITLATSSGFLVKLDNSGQVVWAISADGDGSAPEGEPLRLAVDAAGNSYVTGEFAGAVYYSFFVAKYDTSGQLLWVSPGDPSRGDDVGVDSSGNCYVGGSLGGTFLAKYDSAGNPIWNVPTMLASCCGGNSGVALAVDADGNSYVPSIDGYAPRGSTRITKYDSAGNTLWTSLTTNVLSGTSHDPFGVPKIAVDLMGNSYVTCDSYLCAKYDNAGNQLWVTNVARFPPSDVYEDVQYGIAVDGGGNSYVTGSFAGTANFGGAILSGGGVYVAKISSSPRLKIGLSGASVLVSWPASAMGFGLESTTSLSPPNWQPARESAVTNGTQIVVTAAINGVSRYFRLHQP